MKLFARFPTRKSNSNEVRRTGLPSRAVPAGSELRDCLKRTFKPSLPLNQLSGKFQRKFFPSLSQERFLQSVHRTPNTRLAARCFCSNLDLSPWLQLTVIGSHTLKKQNPWRTSARK